MEQTYQVLKKDERENQEALASFLSRNGQLLMPMMELIEQSRMAVDEVIDVVGRATIEAVLELSAAQVAGPRTQGKERGEVGWHGRQRGRVTLKERKLRVKKPRLRRRGLGAGKEVPIPAYEAMQDEEGMGARMLEILMRGISTRQYQHVLPEMAETVGVSRSSVSRESIEAGEAELERLRNRRFDDLDLLIIYIDGMAYGEYQILSAVGVDVEGGKHVLGIQEGATENEAAVKDLLESLVARGVKPDRQRLFVIDGAKALRAGIKAVFGADQPVQRCRSHKVRNVLDRVPAEQKEQVKSLMRAAYRLDYEKGLEKMKGIAAWLEHDYPAAAASLLEGMEECFTINKLHVPPSLHRCLATTNLIESPQSGVRMRTRRVCRWRDIGMIKRWVGTAFLVSERSFRRLMGYRDLWALKAILQGSSSSTQQKVA